MMPFLRVFEKLAKMDGDLLNSQKRPHNGDLLGEEVAVLRAV